MQIFLPNSPIPYAGKYVVHYKANTRLRRLDRYFNIMLESFYNNANASEYVPTCGVEAYSPFCASL